MWDSDDQQWEGHIRSGRVEKKPRNGRHCSKGRTERAAGEVVAIGLGALVAVVGDIDLDP